MKCPGCEYELWNLKAGPCPECGRPFKPSEFDFLANAVKFCCPDPHCSQAYYGTGEHGELVPSEFDCVSCGRHLTTDDMLLLPADELGKREATRFPNPWLDPHKGTISRWFATVGASIGQPGKLMEATPTIGSTGKSLSFALMNVVVAGISGLVCAGLSLLGAGGGGTAFSIMAALLAPMAYLFVWAATTHGLLKLFKADTSEGMGRTVQAIAFGSGGWVMAIIPCLGPLVGFPAWSVSATLAVRAAHKTAGWKASLATLTLPVLTVLGAIGLYVWTIFSTLAAVNSISPQPVQHGWASGTRLEWETVDLANELRTAINANNPPLHGASLLSQNSPVMFTAFGDAQDYDAPIGGTTASALDAMPDPTRASALAAITSSWPADVTAHRIGNIVFTHYGIKAGDDARLWVLVELPGTSFDTFADAVHLNGASMFNTRTAAQITLDQQNRLRIKAGLSPLPDYQTLTASDGPWTAADGVAPPPP